MKVPPRGSMERQQMELAVAWRRLVRAFTWEASGVLHWVVQVTERLLRLSSK